MNKSDPIDPTETLQPNSPGNSPDRAIDLTLTALRQAAPSAGLEQRVLRSLAVHSAVKSATRRTFPWLAVPLMACVVLVALAVMLPLHRERPAVSAPHGASGPTSTAAPTPTPQLISAETVLPRPRILHVSRAVRSNEAARHATIQSASRPATLPPPAPLTQEERLLQQIARAGVPNQIAMLMPEVRARAEAEDDAEFRQYFNSTHVQIP